MMARREKVFIAKVPDYEDNEAIVAAVARGLESFGYDPPGRLVAKANWVLAHDLVARAGYTRPEFLRGALEAIFARNPESRVTFAGNSGAGIPTRVMAKRARGKAPEFRRRGAFELERLFPGKITIDPTDSGTLRRYRLSVGEPLTAEERAAPDPGALDARKRYWREVTTSACLFDAEGVIFFPKLKSNVLAHGVSGALDLQGIGFLLDERRMDGHNFHNHRRIVDMLEVTEPDLIITDGIEMALGGNQMTQRGYPLGIIVMARNAVAHDATISRILGVRPDCVEHIRIAHERGYGPIWASDIELDGDLVVGAANARVRSFGDTGFLPIVDFPRKYKREAFVEFPLEILARPPWDVAGAHGIVLDWLYMTYDFRDRRRGMAAWPPATLMAGGFPEGDLPEPAHDRVYLIGDGAIMAWRRLGWRAWGLTIPRFIWSHFRCPRRIERYTRPDGRKGTAVLIPGDPPAHRDLIVSLALMTLGKVRAPLFRLDLIIDSYVKMLFTTIRRWWRNRKGVETVEARAIERLKARKAARAAAVAAAAAEPAAPAEAVPPESAAPADAARAPAAEAPESATEAPAGASEAAPAAESKESKSETAR